MFSVDFPLSSVRIFISMGKFQNSHNDNGSFIKLESFCIWKYWSRRFFIRNFMDFAISSPAGVNIC